MRAKKKNIPERKTTGTMSSNPSNLRSPSYLTHVQDSIQTHIGQIIRSQFGDVSLVDLSKHPFLLHFLLEALLENAHLKKGEIQNIGQYMQYLKKQELPSPSLNDPVLQWIKQAKCVVRQPHQCSYPSCILSVFLGPPYGVCMYHTKCALQYWLEQEHANSKHKVRDCEHIFAFIPRLSQRANGSDNSTPLIGSTNLSIQIPSPQSESWSHTLVSPQRSHNRRFSFGERSSSSSMFSSSTASSTEDPSSPPSEIRLPSIRKAGIQPPHQPQKTM